MKTDDTIFRGPLYFDHEKQRVVRSYYRIVKKEEEVWPVPESAPCRNCISRVGSGICRTSCDFWSELVLLRDSGELKVETIFRECMEVVNLEGNDDE